MNAFLRKIYSQKVVPQNVLSETLQGWNIVNINNSIKLSNYNNNLYSQQTNTITKSYRFLNFDAAVKFVQLANIYATNNNIKATV